MKTIASFLAWSGSTALFTRICLLPIALTLVSSSPQALGAVLIVTNSADSGPGTLRDRIASANANDSIHFSFTSLVTLNSPLLISKNLNITGPNGSGLKISGNNSTRIFNILAGTVQIEDLTIADGRVSGATGAVGVNGENVFGGGIVVSNGATLRLTQCVLSNNMAVGGQGGTPSQFGGAANGGNGFGGGIANFGSLFMSRCHVKANTAVGGLGGVGPVGSAGTGGQGWGGALYSAGSADVSHSTLHANSAIAGSGDGGPGGGSGGGIYNNATMTITASTIVSNTATGSSFDFGGGIAENGTLTVHDSTIVGNQAVYGGGVTGGDYGNTIIAGNSASNGPDGIGSIVSVGINLIQNTNGLSITGFTTYNITGQDPLLGPLKDNGALDFDFTPPNMAPLPGSPVIDKGANYYSGDQRLYPRPYDTSIPNVSNGSDIGAIELQPTTLVVTNTNNSGPGSLRQAILDNNGVGGGNTITFATNVTGTITLTGAGLTITAPVTIAGPGANVLAVSGNDAVRVFLVLKGPSQINGLTIRNGFVSGGSGQQGQNGFDAQGAGIFSQDTLSIGGCTIRSNRVIGGLGGERHLGSVGNGGKGIGAGICNASANLSLGFCTLEGNIAEGGQGGMSQNGAAGGGGNGLGGAISTAGGTLNMSSCNFLNNVAAGGLGGTGGTPGGGGQGYGAGLYNEATPTVISYSTFEGGNARGGTGGGNGSGYGGGIYNQFNLALLMCTVASNSASGSSFDFGGGIYNVVNNMGITNVTIAGNQADYGGGLNGNADAANSIVAANTATSSGSDVSGTINSFDYNLVQNLGGLNIIGATDHVITGQDPLLAPLANNGGFGRTMALRFGSPTIDKGRNFSFMTDQRGAPRPFDFDSIANASGGDGTDIGAFELGLPRLIIARVLNDVVLRWPYAFGDFILESAPAVAGANWTTVTNIPVEGPAEQWYVTNSIAAGNRFFLLKSR